VAAGMGDAESFDVSLLWADLSDSHKGHSNVVFAILASLLEGRALAVLKSQKHHRHGYEAWRLLCKEFEPKSESPAGALLRACLDAKMLDNSQSLDTFMGSVMDWERLIEEYERASDELFPMLIQKSTLAAKAPQGLQVHMQMNAASLETYADVRKRLEAYWQARTGWASGSDGGVQPMEIGAYDSKCKFGAQGICFKHGAKGGGKGGGKKSKGNDKGKGKGGKGGKGVSEKDCKFSQKGDCWDHVKNNGVGKD
jgi:hypothetical protein